MIAHRGASYDVAEHTLPAYLSAIDNGADGLECDVRLTRDGHLVCVHDRTVNRTSNGSGIVSEYDLSALRELDFQSWRDQLPDSPTSFGMTRPIWPGLRRTGCRPTAPGTHPGEPAGGGGRRRPADPTAGRDQASDPVRRPGGEGTGAVAAALRLGVAARGRASRRRSPS